MKPQQYRYPTKAQVLGKVAHALRLGRSLEIGEHHDRTYRDLFGGKLAGEKVEEKVFQDALLLFVKELLPPTEWPKKYREMTESIISKSLAQYQTFAFRMNNEEFVSAGVEPAAEIYGLLRLLMLELALRRGAYLCLCELGELKSELDFSWVYCFNDPFPAVLRGYHKAKDEVVEAATDSELASVIAGVLGPKLAKLQGVKEVECYDRVLSWLQAKHNPNPNHLKLIAQALAEPSDIFGHILLHLRISLGLHELLDELRALLGDVGNEIVEDLLIAFNNVSWRVCGILLQEEGPHLDHYSPDLLSSHPPKNPKTGTLSLVPKLSELGKEQRKQALIELILAGSSSKFGKALCQDLSQCEIKQGSPRVKVTRFVWTEFAADIRTLGWVWDFRVARWSILWPYLKLRDACYEGIFSLKNAEAQLDISQLIELPELSQIIKKHPDDLRFLKKKNPTLSRLAESTSGIETDELLKKEFSLYLAEMAFSCGDFREANRRFMAVLALAPSAIIYHRVGQVAFMQVYLSKSRYHLEKAVDALKQALVLEPNRSSARLLLSLALLMLGKFNDLEPELAKLKKDGKFFSHAAGWLENIQKGSPLSALRDLDKAYSEKGRGHHLQPLLGRYMLLVKKHATSRNIEAARKELRRLGFQEEWFEPIEQMVKGMSQKLKELPLTPAPEKMKSSWIAIEGLDGSGKSTTVALLAEVLGAVKITNPPASLAEERRQADQLPDAERRDWYMKANVEAVRQAVTARDAGKSVVMDRSVASTLAFAAAEQGRVARLDEWPSNIPRPDLLVMLNVPEPERCRRLQNRKSNMTSEERRLLSDPEFCQRVLDGYASLFAVSVIATGTPSEVVQNIVALLQSITGSL